MTRYQIRNAIQVVGSREKLNKMVLGVAESWEVSFLEGLAEHLKAGKSLEKYFIKQDPRLIPVYANPEYIRVEKEEGGYRVVLGICFDGTCGEGAAFRFTDDGDFECDQFPEFWMH